MKKNVFYAVTAVTMLLASCTIQQRVYQPGLSIEWKNLNQRQTKSDLEQNTKVLTATAETQLEVSNEVVNSIEGFTAAEATEPLIADVIAGKEQTVSKQAVKQAVKEFRKEVSAAIANESAVASIQSYDEVIERAGKPHAAWVYILLIFFLPFGTTYSVYLFEGSWTKKVTTNLILTLLCGIPGLIHALVTIFGKK